MSSILTGAPPPDYNGPPWTPPFVWKVSPGANEWRGFAPAVPLREPVHNPGGGGNARDRRRARRIGKLPRQ